LTSSFRPHYGPGV